MRTTLEIDDDVLAAAKSLARSHETSLGAMVSQLLRRALAPRSKESSKGGFPVFRVSADAPLITLERVREALDD